MGKNWVTMGFCGGTSSQKLGRRRRYDRAVPLTLRYSTGLVTLNLSMVEMMMAGVVRKKSSRNRMQLMIRQRIHQETPPSDRCSLSERTPTRHSPETPPGPQAGPGPGWDPPAHVLGVGRVRDIPVVHVERVAELRGPRLLPAAATLHLTRVEVFQDSEGTTGARVRGRASDAPAEARAALTWRSWPRSGR